MHTEGHNMGITNDLVFTTEEVAQKLKTHRNMVDKLRRNGLLNGIKLGKGFIYPCTEVEAFLTTYAGTDLSNEEAMIHEKERRSNHG